MPSNEPYNWRGTRRRGRITKYQACAGSTRSTRLETASSSNKLDHARPSPVASRATLRAPQPDRANHEGVRAGGWP